MLFCQSPSFVTERIRAIAGETYSESASIAEEGDPEAMSKVVDPETFIRRMLGMKTVKFGPSEAGEPFSHRRNNAIRVFSSGSIPQELQPHIRKLHQIPLRRVHASLSSPTPSTGPNRLRSIFEDRGDKIEFTPVEYTIHEGFVDHATKTCFFTTIRYLTVSTTTISRSDKARGGKLALSLRELNQIETGDYIVHIDHGIGRFGGLVRTSVNGTPQEMIKLYYQNNDLVLVSIHALHKLSKYRGKEGIPPKISKLGGGAWTRMKEKTKER